MMTEREKAKQRLRSGGFTCVLCKDSVFHTSDKRGVRPLLTWYQSGADFSGFSAADKVIGKATAFLYVMLGVKSVYGGVVSRSALEVLTSHGIDVEYDFVAENIINRTGDGICPFEAAVLDIDDCGEAYGAICGKMEELCG